MTAKDLLKITNKKAGNKMFNFTTPENKSNRFGVEIETEIDELGDAWILANRRVLACISYLSGSITFNNRNTYFEVISGKYALKKEIFSREAAND